MSTTTVKAPTAIEADLSARIAEVLSGYTVTATPAPGAIVDGKIEVPQSLVREVLAARAAVEAAERAKVRAENAVKVFMGEAVEATIEGETIFTFKPGERTGLDQAALKEQRPEVWAHFLKATPVRPLLVKSKIVAKFFA